MAVSEPTVGVLVGIDEGDAKKNKKIWVIKYLYIHNTNKTEDNGIFFKLKLLFSFNRNEGIKEWNHSFKWEFLKAFFYDMIIININ